MPKEDPTVILSAAHGLLDPDTFGDPYDLTLSKMSVKDHNEWAMWVVRRSGRIQTCDPCVPNG